MGNSSFRTLESFQCLMDILEDTVEEKYYLSQEKVHRLIEDMEERKALLFEPDEKKPEGFSGEPGEAGREYQRDV
mgnify:CR=1 FL=1